MLRWIVLKSLLFTEEVLSHAVVKRVALPTKQLPLPLHFVSSLATLFAAVGKLRLHFLVHAENLERLELRRRLKALDCFLYFFCFTLIWLERVVFRFDFLRPAVFILELGDHLVLKLVEDHRVSLRV